MALPEEHDAFQQIRAAQEGTVIGIGTANHDMVATSGAGVAAVDHELFGSEARLPRFFIDRCSDVDAFPPTSGRMDVDLDDARVGCDTDDIQARVVRRRVAFDM